MRGGGKARGDGAAIGQDMLRHRPKLFIAIVKHLLNFRAGVVRRGFDGMHQAIDLPVLRRRPGPSAAPSPVGGRPTGQPARRRRWLP